MSKPIAQIVLDRAIEEFGNDEFLGIMTVIRRDVPEEDWVFVFNQVEIFRTLRREGKETE